MGRVLASVGLLVPLAAWWAALGVLSLRPALAMSLWSPLAVLSLWSALAGSLPTLAPPFSSSHMCLFILCDGECSPRTFRPEEPE